MDCTLVNHTRGYQFTPSTAFASAVTGFSGIPFAVRHWQLSFAEHTELLDRWAHRLICLFEAVPIFGGVIAVVERICFALLGSAHAPIPWRSTPLSAEAAHKKMENQLVKAAIEHRGDHLSVNQVNDEVLAARKRTPKTLSFRCQEAENIGPRPTMEDSHFYTETDEGVASGVFDGHGGKEVSAFACKQFQEKFPKALADSQGNVHAAFERVLHEIHVEVVRHPEWNRMGSTAVVCYIDKKTNKIYTATLGDSEANIYRNVRWSLRSIPLSCVRDWMAPNERARLENAFGKKAVEQQLFHAQHQAKGVRSRLNDGVNVSRAIGDVNETGTPNRPLVLHRPKITVAQLRPGDVVTLACDGLKDYVSETQILQTVSGYVNTWFGKSDRNLAQLLVDRALANMELPQHRQAGDNVTVLAIEVR
jgi:serine/threonine protein phosphatase PrpC